MHTKQKITSMDEQIKKLARTLKTEYGLFILLPVLLCILAETDWFPTGYYADDARMQYVLGTLGILLTLTLVPLSLKLFSFKLFQKLKEAPVERAFKRYKTYCGIRIGLLAVVVLTNIAFYYLTLQNTGLFCTFIGLAASLFCIPGESKIRQELNFE